LAVPGIGPTSSCRTIGSWSNIDWPEWHHDLEMVAAWAIVGGRAIPVTVGPDGGGAGGVWRNC